jgi:hypothetical protein
LLGADVFRQAALVSAVLSAGPRQTGVLNITGGSASGGSAAFVLECIDLLCSLSALAFESHRKRDASHAARDAVVDAFTRKAGQFMRCTRELSDKAFGSVELACVSRTQYVELAVAGFE